MTELDQIEGIIERVKGMKGNADIMLLLYAHRPFTQDFGDQRDPDVQITCTCRKDGWSATKLGIPYFIHLYDIIAPLVATKEAYDGR